MLPLFFGKVENGKVLFDDRVKFTDWVRKLEGQKVEISIGKPQNRRTIAENKYYWGVVVKIIGDELGLIPDEAHELLKSLFLKKGIEGKGKFEGKRWEVVGSTAKMSIKNFEKYLEKCRLWAMAQNITIPLPNEIILEN